VGDKKPGPDFIRGEVAGTYPHTDAERKLAESIPFVLRNEWAIDLTCCGVDDGTEVFQTWKEADDFRRSYINVQADDHGRVGVIRRAREGEVARRK
jgi:hypothetical protein